MRFGLLRTKTVLGANVSGFILGTRCSRCSDPDAVHAAGARLLGDEDGRRATSPSRAPRSSTVAAALVNRVGVRPLIAGGMALLALGMILFAQIPVDGSTRPTCCSGS